MPDFLSFAERYFPYILKGAVVTLELTVLSLIISVAFGLIAAVCKLSGRFTISAAANVYIELVRGTPALLQLFVIYFGLTSYGVNLNSFTAAVLTLGFIGGAYLAEVFRAGIESVDRGQVEAAVSLGMRPGPVMRRIILPQALVLTLPPFTNFVIALVKDTSLASTILVTELLRKAQEIAAPSFDFFTLYGVAAVYYWVVCLVLSFNQNRLETRLSRYVAA